MKGAPCDKKPLPPAPWPANGYELQSLLQGHWFSTRAESECVGAARPGDGSACTWRLLPTGQVAKNVSCVHRKVMESVMAKNQTCFSSCADGNNPLPSNPSNCWTECTFQTIIGTWTGLYGGGRNFAYARTLMGCTDPPPMTEVGAPLSVLSRLRSTMNLC